jgi:hypothetical protein
MLLAALMGLALLSIDSLNIEVNKNKEIGLMRKWTH